MDIKKVSLLLLLFWVVFKYHSQSNVLGVSFSQPSNIVVCEDRVIYTLTFRNQSSINSLTDISSILELPQGLYVDSIGQSSPSGIIFNSSDSSRITFTISSLPLNPNPGIQIPIYVKANCLIFDHLSSGGNTKLIINSSFRVNGNAILSSNSYGSNPIVVQEANLSIYGTLYQSKLAEVGDTYTRCFEIKNVGDGKTSQFRYINEKGNTVTINDITLGLGGVSIPYTINGNTVTVTLDASIIPNGFLNTASNSPDNVLTICEEITIDACTDVESAIYLEWGCEGLNCQRTPSISANTVFEGLSPKIEITPTSNISTCFGLGNRDTMALLIENNGNGDAFNVQITVSQGWWRSFYRNMYSSIDTNSLVLLNEKGGNISYPFIWDSAWSTNTKACLPANPKGRFVITIPEIKKDSSYYLRWEVIKCCIDDPSDLWLRRGWRMHMLGWNYEVGYLNQCDNFFNIPTTYENRNYDYTKFGTDQNSTRIQYFRSPPTVNAPSIGGDASCNITTVKHTEVVTNHFYITTSEIYIPRDTSDYMEFEFTLPPCLTLQPTAASPNGVFFTSQDGNKFFPSSVSVSGNVVKAFYKNLPHDPLNQEELCIFDKAVASIETIVNCSNCGFQDDTASVDLNIYMIPDASCNCRMLQGYSSNPLIFNCNVNCGQDFYFQDYCVYRENVGLPDFNDDGNPDGGTVWASNFDKVRRDRIMVGDTIISEFVGRIPSTSSVSTNNMNYLYAYTKFTDGGAHIQYLNSDISITRYNLTTGNILYTATIDEYPLPCIVSNVVGDDREFYVELDLDNLSGINFSPSLPSNFTIQAQDIIRINPRFVMKDNFIGEFKNTKLKTRYYVTTIQDTGASVSECDGFNANLSLVGYYFESWNPQSYKSHSCNIINTSQNFYLSIGNCCNNYSGGNMFPYEYRRFATPDIFTLETKYPYDLREVNVTYYRTTYALDANGDMVKDIRTRCNDNLTNTTYPLNPILQPNGKYHYNVDMKQFLIDQNCDFGDDGFSGTLNFRLYPNCKVKDEPDTVIYLWRFDRASQLDLTESSPRRNPGVYEPITNFNNDVIDYDPPIFYMQSLLPSIQTEDSLVEWEVLVTNIANESRAENVWLANASPFGSIRITSIENITSGSAVPLTANSGNIYQLNGLGQVGPGDELRFKVKGIIQSCNTDSIQLAVGWDCGGGIPANIAAYPCEPTYYSLNATPLKPKFDISVYSAVDSSLLCEEVEYTIELENILLGTAYNMNLKVLLPPGMTYVNATSEAKYPSSSAFTPSINPTINGSELNWDLDLVKNYFLAKGFLGATHIDSNKLMLKFRLTTNCDYISGVRFDTYVEYERACRLREQSSYFFSEPLHIKNLNIDYSTNLKIYPLDDIRPCVRNTPIAMSLINNGPSTTDGSVDTLSIRVPIGLNYTPSSFLNTGINTTTLIGTEIRNGFEYLFIKLPSIPMNDSASIRFEIEATNVDDVDCGIHELYAYHTTQKNATCGLDTCNLKLVVGDTILPIISNKSLLYLNNDQSVSNYLSSTQERANINFEILNLGEPVASGSPTIISFYYDIDRNRAFSFSDQLIIRDTIYDTIPYNSPFNYLFNFDFPSNYSCNIIAVIDSSLNPCSCNGTQIPIDFEYHNVLYGDSICTEDFIQLGVFDSVQGFTYKWDPIQFVLNPFVAAPTFYADTNIQSPINMTYTVTTTKPGGCKYIDSLNLTIVPKSIGIGNYKTIVCENQQFTGNATPLNYPYTGTWTFTNNAITCSDTNNSNALFTNLSYDTNFLYWNIYNAVCDVTTIDTFRIIVNQRPLITPFRDTSLCINEFFRFVPEYTPSKSKHIWTEPRSNPQTGLITNRFNDTLKMTFTTEGRYFYIFNLKNGICDTIKDTLWVDVYKTPKADILVDTIFDCENSTFILEGDTNISPYDSIIWDFPNHNFTITDSNKITGSISNLSFGDYLITLTVFNDACPISIDSAIVRSEQQPTIDVNLPELDLCQGVNYTYTPNITPIFSSTLWIEHPNNPSLNEVADVNDSPLNVTLDTPGDYQFILEVTNGKCTKVYDTLILHIYKTPEAIVVDDTLNICRNFDFTLNAVNNISFYDNLVWRWITPAVTPIMDSNSVIASVSGISSGSHQVELIITNQYCPESRDSLGIFIKAAPTAQFYSSSRRLCQEHCLYFIDTSYININNGYIENFIWTIGSETVISNTDSLLFCANEAGNLDVTLIAISNYGCPDTITKTNYFVVDDRPDAAFEISPDENLINGMNIKYTDMSSPDVIDLTYYFGDGDSSKLENPIHEFYKGGLYTARQIVTNGICLDTFYISLNVKERFVVYVPNAFTPNGDNGNELFNVSIFGEDVDYYHLMIFNRWGEKIFETNNKQESWDGLHKGVACQDGAYIWKLTCSPLNSTEKYTYTGHVILFK